MIDGPPSKHILACLRRVPCDRNPSVFLHKLLLTKDWKHCNVADIAQIGVNVFKTKILSEKSGRRSEPQCVTYTVRHKLLLTKDWKHCNVSQIKICCSAFQLQSLHNVNDQFVTRWLSRNPHYMWPSKKYLWFFHVNIICGWAIQKERNRLGSRWCKYFQCLWKIWSKVLDVTMVNFIFV